MSALLWHNMMTLLAQNVQGGTMLTTPGSWTHMLAQVPHLSSPNSTQHFLSGMQKHFPGATLFRSSSDTVGITHYRRSLHIPLKPWVSVLAGSFLLSILPSNGSRHHHYFRRLVGGQTCYSRSPKDHRQGESIHFRKNLTLKQTFIIWFIIWHGIKSVENHRNQKYKGIGQTFIQLEVKH